MRRAHRPQRPHGNGVDGGDGCQPRNPAEHPRLRPGGVDKDAAGDEQSHVGEFPHCEREQRLHDRPDTPKK